jgi:hypothetical protein
MTGSGTAATVQLAARAVQTASDGSFRLEMERSGDYVTVVSAGGFVARETVSHTGVTAAHQQLSLIPQQFDLRSFDEFCRTANGRLQRWMKAPALVILTSVMTYVGPSESSYVATGERLSESELDVMVEDFTRALRLLSGNTWSAFDRVVREDVSEGERATVLRDGMVVVGRYRGIVSWSNTIGLGRWHEQADGTVSAGTVFLDDSFDKSDDRRWLLRMHEFGHALGYTHVTSRVSVMNPSIGPEPTTFDVQAASIAFQRAPGNRAPDVDPSGGAVPSGFLTTSGTGRWAAPVICGLPHPR